MASNAIQQLVSLLEKNPTLVTQLTQVASIDDALKLVKSKGLEIAKAELQEYMVKNLAKNFDKEALLKGAATGILKGILGKK